MLNKIQATEQNNNVLTTIGTEIDRQIVTAKQYPRDIQEFCKATASIVNQSPEIAESCYYTIPRQGKHIEGPSVRLAEIVITCWGNLHTAMRILKNKDGRTVTAEAAVWDLEKNVRVTQEIERSIVDSKGKLYSDNMQQVTKVAAQSIAFRNVIFKIVPRCFVESLYVQAKRRVQQEADKVGPRQIRRKIDNVIEKIKNLGMSEKTLLKALQRPSLEAIQPEDYSVMIGIGTAIKEGSLQVTEIANDDNKNIETISIEEKNILKDKAKAHGIKNELLHEALGVDSLDQLPKSQFNECVELIEGRA